MPTPHIGSGTSSAACSDNDGDNVRRADSARGSFTALSAVVIPGSDITQASSTSAAAHQATDNFWKDDLSNLLTPQTVMEQAQVQRRKRNREAARRSRLKQKERERELVERQTQLSERMRFLQQEVEEWRIINSTAPRATQSPSQTLTLPLSSRLIDPEQVLGKEDGDLAENINNVYTLTVETLHIIAELQLQLDEITKELDEMIGDSTSR
ncbi:hypothetical protein H4R26_001302 [Coemansia thaxteri]|uniref:BZIP domain-containing protein n=1 Tax=Coemansia thaxteri TaxID=2663907 RepID=A0A9W8BH28_9FUNG|nr:hypothetical protein H4R26_001302 [Coemansia thaxteri]